MTVDRSLFVDPAERELCAALTSTDIDIADNAARRDYDAALIAAGALVEPITRFFEQVLVMDPQKEIRANRLKLVTDVATSLRLLGDFEQLPGVSSPVADGPGQGTEAAARGTVAADSWRRTNWRVGDGDRADRGGA